MLSPILVAGEWRRGRGDVYASRYPADDTVNAELAAANVADVEEAIEAADAARRGPDGVGSSRMSVPQSSIESPASSASRAEELAKLQLRDNGKPIAETRALVASAAGTFQFFAAACETLEETITPCARRLRHDERPRAAGCGRSDYAVELADRQRGAEARPGARGRQCSRRQAGRGDAAPRPRARSHLRGGRRAQGGGERPAGQGLGDRRCNREAPAGEEGFFHRGDDDRQGARAARCREADAGHAGTRRQVPDDRVR